MYRYIIHLALIVQCDAHTKAYAVGSIQPCYITIISGCSISTLFYMVNSLAIINHQTVLTGCF